MMSHDKLKYQASQQFLSRDKTIILRQRLHYIITVKHLDKAKDTFCLITSEVLRHATPFFSAFVRYTILQNKRMRRCPPPIIFERLKLPQQIIYRRKGNLSESPHHQKYWENILISRFYEQFSRNSRILGHFWKFEKNSNS